MGNKLNFAGFLNHSFVPYPPFVTAKETLEFLTDIVLTHNGTEDRTRNRTIARQTVTTSVRTDLLNRQSPYNLSLQNIRGPWGVPLWGEAQFVGTVSGTTIVVDPVLSAFKAGNLALVYQNAKSFQVVQIIAINATQLVVTPSVDLKNNAIVVPISAGTVKGDISNDASGYQSVYGFDYRVTDPKMYPTKIGVVFAIDNSGSMSGDRMASVKNQIVKTLDALSGAIKNSNVAVDLGIVFFSTVQFSMNFDNANVDDISEAIAFVESAASPGSDRPQVAFEYANNFFENVTPNPGDRKDIMFVMTDATASTTAAAITGANMLNRVSPFNPPNDVDVYAINIDLSDPTQALKIDNASNGVIAVVNSENPDALFERFIFAIDPVIGKQHKGFEVVTSMPIGSRMFTKEITKIEDDVDFDLGRFETLSPWLNARVGSNHGFFLDGLDGVRNFKKFIYRRAGKQGGFYLPTFEHDIRVTSFSGDMLSAFINDDDFAAYNENRKELAIRFVDDTWQIVTITSVTSVGLGGYRLDFEKPIQKGLQFIERFCYMGLARFDTDRIEITYVGDGCAECNVNMLELSE